MVVTAGSFRRGKLYFRYSRDCRNGVRGISPCAMLPSRCAKRGKKKGRRLLALIVSSLAVMLDAILAQELPNASEACKVVCFNSTQRETKQRREVFPAKCLLLLSSLYLAASWKCLIIGCRF